MGRAPTVRLELIQFAADFTAKYGQKPTMKQAAQALGRSYPAVKRMVSEFDLIEQFSRRGRVPTEVSKSAAIPPVVKRPTMRRKWLKVQALVRAAYPSKYGSDR